MKAIQQGAEMLPLLHHQHTSETNASTAVEGTTLLQFRCEHGGLCGSPQLAKSSNTVTSGRG